MRNLWKVGALGAVFGAVLSAGGCSDFDAAYEKCEQAGRCGPQANEDAGIDGGADAGDGGDGGDVTPPPCGDGGVDYPDLTGFDNDCDGIDGVADAGYFVDPAGGKDDEYDGTRTKPFRTLARALREIRDGGTGRSIVYLGTGTYNEPAPVVDMPVALYGGYTWRGNEYWDRFKRDAGTTFFDGGTVAFTVRDVAGAEVVMEGLTIASADAKNAGEPSIALRVIRSSAVRLRRVLVEAGKGADGELGTPGNPGAQGGAGLDGGSAAGFGSGRRGDGGSSICSTGDAGLGGLGGTGNNFQQGFDGGDGFPNTPGGAGGAPGVRVTAGPDVYNCIAEQGLDGGTGAVGATGGPGSAGQGSGTVVLETGLWQRSSAQQGIAGNPGRIGAGGGGGGGGGTCSDSSLSPQDLGGAGGGGGGGGGGCGGEAGKGGGGGSASIALLLIDSEATAEADSHLTTRGGGQGGPGGAGGDGGSGGPGGIGGRRASIRVDRTTETYDTFGGHGGNGGPGGAGGRGGPGGGGAGGPSIGVWCAADAGFAIGQGTIVDPANGGGGGPSEGNPGDEGRTAPILDCRQMP